MSRLSRFGVVILAAVVLGQVSANAATSPPFSFDDLVARADVIFIGEVTDVRPFPLETREGMVIKTRVTFRVSDPIWGTTRLLEVFDFIGGKWGDLELAVSGMPEFSVGDRRVVFAYRNRSINPIVGFTQGLLQIRRDGGGVDRVFTLGGAPLGQPESVGAVAPPVAPLGLLAPTASAAPMPLSQFRSHIGRALAAAQR